MGTRNVSLPDELDQYIEAKLASGSYAHASEVVRDALRLLMEQEAAQLDALRAEIQRGIRSGEEEGWIPDEVIVEQVKREGRELLQRRGKTTK